MPTDFNRWEHLTKEEIWVLKAWGRGELTKISSDNESDDDEGKQSSQKERV